MAVPRRAGHLPSLKLPGLTQSRKRVKWQGRDNQVWNSKATRQGRALSCDSLIPGPAQPSSTMAREDLRYSSGPGAPGPHVPGRRLGHHGCCLRLLRAPSPPHIGCGAEGQGRGDASQLGAKSPSLLKPVGQEHHRRKLGPGPRRPAKAPALPPWSAPRGGGGFATPDSSLQRPQPGPDSTRKSFQTTHSVTTVTLSSKPEWDSGQAWGRTVPQRAGPKSPSPSPPVLSPSPSAGTRPRAL